MTADEPEPSAALRVLAEAEFVVARERNRVIAEEIWAIWNRAVAARGDA